MRRKANQQSGFVLVLTALTLVVLLGIAGFAVDLGNWYLTLSKMQRAADAAALAGTPYLPSDSIDAKKSALALLMSNGYNPATASISQSALDSNEINVSFKWTVKNSFISLLGIPDMTLGTIAHATHRGPISMGSPSNVLGSEPAPPSSGSNSSAWAKWEKPLKPGIQPQQYWLSIAGGAVTKDRGNRWTSGACDPSVVSDGCNGSANAEYNPAGQAYIVRVQTAGPIQVDAYDPEFANVGDQCGANLTNAGSVDPQLYAVNPGQYCTGDFYPTSGVNGPAPMSTTFELDTPANSPGGSQPVCPAETFAGYDQPVAPLVDPSSPSYDPVFTSEFRKWVPLCKFNVNATAEGDYILHVTTPPWGAGINNFSIRAAAVNGATPTRATFPKSNNIEVFAAGQLEDYINETAASAKVFVARIPALAGERLTLQAFDVGDASQPATVQILPPPDGQSGGTPLTTFSGCTYEQPGTSSFIPTQVGCSISDVSHDGVPGVQPSWNARTVPIDVPIPSDFTCADADPQGCWVTMRISYPPGTSVQDVESWSATAQGSPVRLVNQ